MLLRVFLFNIRKTRKRFSRQLQSFVVESVKKAKFNRCGNYGNEIISLLNWSRYQIDLLWNGLSKEWISSSFFLIRVELCGEIICWWFPRFSQKLIWRNWRSNCFQIILNYDKRSIMRCIEIHALLERLYYVFILIIQCEYLRISWKIALICPIHKNGGASMLYNYRTISIFSTFSKLN